MARDLVLRAALAVCFLAPMAGSGAFAGAPSARVLQTVEGDDWSLPAYAKLTPYSGYIHWDLGWLQKHAQMPRYQDGNIHFAYQVHVRWSDANPSEGVTVPETKIDISKIGQTEGGGPGHEFHARRTDVAKGGRFIYFRTERKFLDGGPHALQLKITYLDGPAANWCVEYAGKDGESRTPAVTTADSGKWKTVAFEIPGMRFAGSYPGGMDFRIAALDKADVTVKLVRLVKPEPPAPRR